MNTAHHPPNQGFTHGGEPVAEAPPAAGEQRIQAVETTFRNILLVVFLLFICAVAQTIMFWRVCDTGMKTARSLEHQGLPTLNTLASLQECLALHRLDSYEYLFANEGEKASEARAADADAAQIRAELKSVKALLPDSGGQTLASNLETAVDRLDAEFQKIRNMVDSDFPAAMKEMDQSIPSRTRDVSTAAAALKAYGYAFAGRQADATFGSFNWIKNYSAIFGAANTLVAFGAVLFVLLASRRSRAQLAETLARLDGRTLEVQHANDALRTDISERKRAEAELETAHRRLLDLSRQAGMAEVATSVLHNVGNVLNSVNISATLVIDALRKSQRANLGKVAAMLDENSANLGAFITADSRGRRLPGFIRELSETLEQEQTGEIKELESLCKHIDHIKDIVYKQQSYAKISGVCEVVAVVDLVEDSLHMNAAALTRHDVELIRDYHKVPSINIDKHKVLQILVNLIRNAKYACDDGGRALKQLTVRVADGGGRIRISVIDNGIGIPPENLTRIFNHGFTTRKEGHGFGLHGGALAAKEMGGSLTVKSDGLGQGASFVLEIPCPAPENP